LAVVAVVLGSTAVAAMGGSAIVRSRPGGKPLDGGARAAAHRFLDGYLDPDGRVVRRDQGGDSVSEGQAYAMLVAQAVGDRRRFALAWEWAHAHLQRAAGLLAWRWADGQVQDPMPAADADLDAAWALLLAAERFRDPGLRDEGLRMAVSVMDHETLRPAGAPGDGVLLAAGPWARDAGMVNPSYISPGAMAALKRESGDPRWHAMAELSERALARLLNPARPLPPDWSRLRTSGMLEPAPAPGRENEGPRFGLDAARLLPRLAACTGAWADLAASTWPVLAAAPGRGTTMASDLRGHPVEGAPHPTKAVGAAAAAHAFGDRRARDALLLEAENLDRRTPTYYGAAWIAMGRLLLTSSLGSSCA